MTEEERELVNAFNRYFSENEVNGIAHRKKQHRFSSQLCDVLVDSTDERFYLAIEAKSIKTSSTNKVYFSQHFSESRDGHQVDRISDFIEKSGRTGFLAIELKQGIGRPRRAFLVPWTEVEERYQQGESGLSLSQIKDFPELDRNGQQYSISPVVGSLLG